VGELPSVTLDEAYRACRRINAHHGRTYFLATRLLPAASRPSVHALYGFARLADEIVDDATTPGDPAVALNSLEKALNEALSGGPYAHPVLLALADTVRRHDIDDALFTEFLASMRMDLTITGYATFADLAEYTHGSAGVIGLQMLPVLGTVVPRAEAAPYAAALGEAFQLTNFLRDVGEDLDRGRLYLPADELAAFGVDRASSNGRGAPAAPNARSGARSRTSCPTPTPCTGGPSRASRCCRRGRGRASPPRPPCTGGSSTRSPTPTTTCSRAGWSCRRGGGCGSRRPHWPVRCPFGWHAVPVDPVRHDCPSVA
jgi:phytoene/squalene synthetase